MQFDVSFPALNLSMIIDELKEGKKKASLSPSVVKKLQAKQQLLLVELQFSLNRRLNM